jgi:energy-coupling factor transporter ATP-binding protein EcfA2
MTSAPLRCRLLIGPPGSGKTTFAARLAPLLCGEKGEPGLILSTDAIREELFGSAAFQGPWDEIRSVLLNTTGTCAIGCSAGGTASASNPRSNCGICTGTAHRLSWISTPAGHDRRLLPVSGVGISKGNAPLPGFLGWKAMFCS